ncbi:ATP-binding cassette domain-containing protein [Aestuariibaculum marinum]|uniref:ATP-binding cassette domain-containing protein n=1 Tax=Aestuariibaculum marinum TaxID=2683592 RepID=UPI001F505563|nr:ABC transporter ATP-binding protein [Aestuariibaculum marinum]
MGSTYLRAEKGKVTGILGRNGSGKSCILNIIFGSLSPKYKLLRINGTHILKALFLSKTVAFLPQHDFIPNRKKIISIFNLFKVNWVEFAKAFPEFYKFKDKHFNQLSGGERRFIEIYLILKKHCDIVLLDEPFNGISPLMIEHVKTLINEEKQNKIIIITDHRYNDVIDVSDNLYLIFNGTSKSIKNLEELETYNYLSMGTLNQ